MSDFEELDSELDHASDFWMSVGDQDLGDLLLNAERAIRQLRQERDEARAVIAELKEALLTFAECADELSAPGVDESNIFNHCRHRGLLNADDLRRARGLLSRLEKGEAE